MRMEGPARLRCRCFHAEVNMYMQPSPSLLARDIFSVMQLWSSLPSFSISLSRDMTEKSGMITLEELFLPSLTPCGYLCLKNIGPSCWRPCSLVSLSFLSLSHPCLHWMSRGAWQELVCDFSWSHRVFLVLYDRERSGEQLCGHMECCEAKRSLQPVKGTGRARRQMLYISGQDQIG
jgi:hypothetical protein